MGRMHTIRPVRRCALTTAWAAAALFCAAGASRGATYELDPAHTFVHFEVMHFGTSTIRGRLGPVSGTVELDRAKGRGALALRVATRSVSTGSGLFDARLRESDLLGSEAYPEAFFVAQQFRFDGPTLQEVRGEFTWRGVSQPLSLHARLFACRQEGVPAREVCGGEFDGVVQRSEFGATFGLPFIADAVHLRVQVEASRRD